MNLLSILFLIIGIFSLGYCVTMVSYSGLGTAFLWFWVLAGIGSLIFAFILRYMYSHSITLVKPLRILFMVACILGITVFGLVEGIIISSGRQVPENGADYVIVLGAQVRGTTVSKALKNRLDTAYEYLLKNENTLVIVSGGQGTGEDISEAEAMGNYLIKKGIQKDRVILEDKSTNTYENFLFSKKFVQTDENKKNIVVVTNKFHIFRAMSIAKKIGFSSVQGLGAPNDDLLTLNYYVREFFAVLKDKVVGNI
jgi:uncharacterized SAM-binding protein YcdF (DUF218 family)